jgi:hypothetical protein
VKINLRATALLLIYCNFGTEAPRVGLFVYFLSLSTFGVLSRCDDSFSLIDSCGKVSLSIFFQQEYLFRFGILFIQVKRGK